MHPTDSMFVTPKFYKPAIILTEELFFLKEYPTKDNFGKNIFINVFTSRPDHLDSKELQKVKEEKEAHVSKMRDLQKKNQEMEDSLRKVTRELEVSENEYKEISDKINNLIFYK